VSGRRVVIRELAALHDQLHAYFDRGRERDGLEFSEA